MPTAGFSLRALFLNVIGSEDTRHVSQLKGARPRFGAWLTRHLLSLRSGAIPASPRRGASVSAGTGHPPALAPARFSSDDRKAALAGARARRRGDGPHRVGVRRRIAQFLQHGYAWRRSPLALHAGA